MPSREEIVEWLREAADSFEMIGTEFLGKKTLTEYAEKMRQRAAQVSAMRCGTCELYDSGTDYATDCCLHPSISISNQGKNFGCFAHEQKEEK